jgi:CDP-paratose 2-epimerase
MKLLITGACGFVGTAIAQALLERRDGLKLFGIDNLMRPGSELNRTTLKRLGVEFIHGDVRNHSDLDALPACDWVIDAAANPSVLAGVNGSSTSRQLFEHNLAGVANVLEYCKSNGAGLVLLSSSRVYSICELTRLHLRVVDEGFVLDDTRSLPAGVSAHGINSKFSTSAPVSLYGSTKLAAEALAVEYGFAFDFPVWVNRCGVLAGEGQFGTPDQGIISYWIHAHRARRLLKYIGFNGTGRQTRDVFHPGDLAALIDRQIRTLRRDGRRIYTAGGGPANSISLSQLTAWCDSRFGSHSPEADPAPRSYDIPWVAMDNRDARRDFNWAPEIDLPELLEKIAVHADCHPGWLEVSGV